MTTVCDMCKHDPESCNERPYACQEEIEARRLDALEGEEEERKLNGET